MQVASGARLGWEALAQAGYHLGVVNPARFRSHDSRLVGMCHGDDFVVAVPAEMLSRFGKVLEKSFDVKRTGYISTKGGRCQSLAVLNRTITLDASGTELSLVPVPSHVQKSLQELGLTDATPAETPRVKIPSEEAVAQSETSLELSREDQWRYRGATMRAAYLAQDRLDICEAVAKLTRHMAKPTQASLCELKRVARYLKLYPGCSMQYPVQTCEDARALHVYTDSDWARDPVGRTSTTGMVMCRGSHCLRHSSTTQSVIGLRSAEAEFYALCMGCVVRTRSQVVVPRPGYRSGDRRAFGCIRGSGRGKPSGFGQGTPSPNPVSLVAGCGGKQIG